MQAPTVILIFMVAFWAKDTLVISPCVLMFSYSRILMSSCSRILMFSSSHVLAVKNTRIREHENSRTQECKRLWIDESYLHFHLSICWSTNREISYERPNLNIVEL